MSAVDTNVILVAASCGEKHSGRDADTFSQCGSMQLDGINPLRQFNPQHITARRTTDACSRREIFGDGLPNTFHLASQRCAQPPDVAVVAACLKELRHNKLR